MIKILFVIDSLGCGGAEKSLVSLLPLLNKEKYDIHLWILHRGGVFENLVPGNVIIEKTPAYTDNNWYKNHLAQLRYSILFRWNSLIKKKEHRAETLWKCTGNLQEVPSEDFDVAIAYQQGLPTYLVASKVKARKKIAWVNVNIFNAGYSAIFNSVFYDKMDYIVPVSKDLETILLDTYPQFSRKYVCIYDILNPELIRRNANEPIPEQELFNQSVTLVTVGRLAVQKNYLLAVEAAKILNEKGIDFRWFFVGEGSERPHIEQKIVQYGLEQRVILLGLRTNPYPYMGHCTVYVQTSSYEGFGLTIAEAKILGKPVVSTDFDVVHDQIVHGQNGLIAEMTATSIAGHIIRMLTDKSLCNHIIENVRNEKNNTYLTEVIQAERIIDEDRDDYMP